MLPVEDTGRGGPIVSSAVVVGALAVLAVTVSTGAPVLEVAPIVALVVGSAVAYRSLLGWQTLLALLSVVILFIPIRRYTVPGDLPFELEPYRALAAFVVAGWLASLLIDQRVRLRRSGLEGPLLLISAGAIGSVAANPGRVAPVEADVVKELTFFASFLLVFFLVVSVVRGRQTVDLLLKILVGCGALVALCAIVESRTEYNAFDHLSRVVPMLELSETPFVPERGARSRVYASAQHPIALGAALAILLPLSLYLARRSGARWWFAGGLLLVGSMATVSRTSVLMIVVVVVIFLWLRPSETKRLWPLVVPALLAVHLALPGTLGSLKQSFFPPGGLLAEQRGFEGYRGSGRIADVSPSLKEFKAQPVLGQGLGTRVTDKGRENARILDNQWLATLLETGLVGVAGWLWLFARSIRRLGRRARADATHGGLLCASLAAVIAAYAVGMVTYDSFSFIQVTFMLFLLLALSTSALARPALLHAGVAQGTPTRDEESRRRRARPLKPRAAPKPRAWGRRRVAVAREVSFARRSWRSAVVTAFLVAPLSYATEIVMKQAGLELSLAALAMAAAHLLFYAVVILIIGYAVDVLSSLAAAKSARTERDTHRSGN
jgi:hypothetical protein